MKRPVWQRVVEPDDPLKWAMICSVIAIILSTASVLIVVIWA